MPDRLASAQWEAPDVVSTRYPFAEGKFWLGRAENTSPIGYRDDRHICLVSGNRGGKGTSVIVNNLCFWPGSAVVVDPKGENATVTAARRGQGNKYCTGLGQAVHVLDPFKVADVDEIYRSSFNPFDALDPDSRETIDEASRLADAIVVVKDDSHDPFWDESARKMLRGIILHVLTFPDFLPEERNLITLRNLITRGDWQLVDAIRADDHDEEKIENPHLLLWRRMEQNPAFNGVISATGLRFRNMMNGSEKQFEGVLQAVDLHTEFLDSPDMQDCLSKSDFKLSELKTRPEGMTLYLSLPQRFMNTHHRWLRMMVILTTTQMEITRGNPATGHPVLIVLDEFAGLKRMEAIEKGVAQLAGFGVKLFFVLQSLEQLKGTYKDHWETFLANAGLKIFFSVEDHFTRDYVSKLAGETEIIREMQSVNESMSESESRAYGQSKSTGSTQSTATGGSRSQSESTSKSTNKNRTDGTHKSSSSNETFGESENESRGGGHSSSSGGGAGGASSSSGSNSSWSNSYGRNHNVSYGKNSGSSSSVSEGVTDGKTSGRTAGWSFTDTLGASQNTGTSETTTDGITRTRGAGRNETVHRRPLIQPDEVGRGFARLDNKDDPFYPGLALVLVTGANPLVVRRTNYFEDVEFMDCFSPHPVHEFLAPVSYTVGGIRPLINQLEAVSRKRLTISKWCIETGDVGLLAHQNCVAAKIDHAPPDNRTLSIYIPYSGKVTQTAAVPENLLPSGDYLIPESPLFTIKNYPCATQKFGDIDPFRELREALRAWEKSCLPKEPARGRAEPKAVPQAIAAPRKSAKAANSVGLLSFFQPRASAFVFSLIFVVVPIIGLEVFSDPNHVINPSTAFWIFVLAFVTSTLAVNLLDNWQILRSYSRTKFRLAIGLLLVGLLLLIGRLAVDMVHLTGPFL